MATGRVALTPARKRIRRRESGLGYLLLIPSLLVFGVFVFWPLVHNVYLGFYRNPPFPGLPSTYVGFDQYKDVLTSQTFVDSVKTTFLFAILTVPVGIAAGLGLAVLAHQQAEGHRHLPHVLLVDGGDVGGGRRGHLRHADEPVGRVCCRGWVSPPTRRSCRTPTGR